MTPLRRVSLAIQHAWDRDRDEIDRMPDEDADCLARAAMCALAIADTHPKDGDVKQAPLVSGGGAGTAIAQPLSSQPPSKEL